MQSFPAIVLRTISRAIDDTGFFGGTLALPSFKADFKLSGKNATNQKANMVSLFQAGSFFGAGLQLPVTERFGRKWAVIVANLIFIASAFVQTFAAGSVVCRLSLVLVDLLSKLILFDHKGHLLLRSILGWFRRRFLVPGYSCLPRRVLSPFYPWSTRRILRYLHPGRNFGRILGELYLPTLIGRIK
jgi:MFS family permease